MPFVRVKNCVNCGIAHEWLFDGMSLQELRTIKQLTNLRAQEFAIAMDETDPDAIAAMIYILHRRDKIVVPFEDVDLDFKDFSIDETEEEIKEREEIEAKAQAAADEAQAPKVANGPRTKAGSQLK